jgi:signal transduction histidine kinase
MTEEFMRRMFEPFERGVSSARYGGLGLGLYITRQIIKAHDGSIEVKSKLGEGSTFVVTLPRVARH